MLCGLLRKKRLADPALNLLQGKNIYLSPGGMTPAELRLQRHLINLLGGFFFSTFIPGLTDTVIAKKVTSALGEAVSDCYSQVDFISLDYLKDCLLYKRILPTHEYRFRDLKKRIEAARAAQEELAAEQAQRQGNAPYSQITPLTMGGGPSVSNEQKFFSQRYHTETGKSQRSQSGFFPALGSALDSNSVQTQSVNTRFKNFRDANQSQSKRDVDFKSFLFEKCLFYFFQKDFDSFEFKKKVLEHSGSIVKEYANLKPRQLAGRDFFIVSKDGFDENDVCFYLRLYLEILVL